jgi:hypothetical protein
MRTLRNISISGAFAFSFSLAAQDPCADIEIISVHYAPFTDTAFQVIVTNNSQTVFFGYPQFSLIDLEGDTIAREQLNSFGIGNGESIHRMDLIAGADLPATPFSGTLLLDYYTGDGPQQCSFLLDQVELCPTSACTDLQVFVHNNSPSIEAVTTTFDWSVVDDQNMIVATGTLEIDAMDQQQDLDDLCLAPGNYILLIEQAGNDGPSFTAGVTQEAFMMNGPNDVFQAGGSLQLPFEYYPACASIGMGVQTLTNTDLPLIVMENERLIVRATDGGSLGSIELLDISGRKVNENSNRSTEISFAMHMFPEGVFILRSKENAWPAQKVIFLRK